MALGLAAIVAPAAQDRGAQPASVAFSIEGMT
jgi:hypothetical protein